MMNKRELELYIHIPFCARKCSYCDFLSFAAPERVYREYMDKLIEEICGQSRCFGDSLVTTIFLGGGTPSLLSPELVGELFAMLYQCFDVAENAEITIEANPGTLTMEKLEVYRESRINRLSLGLQSADDQELKFLGRIHSFDDFLKSYQRARQAGFSNISVDLMSALPGQDVHSWKNTLRKVTMLKPEHISAYSLMIEEGTLFYDWYGEGIGVLDGGAAGDWREGQIDLPPLPDEDTDREIYHMTRTFLASQGYERYEISNYARPGFACRHNVGYWTGVDYLGLGLGASSYIGGYRYRNVSDMKEYLSLDLKEAGAAARDIQELTLTDKMEEFMFLGLRMMEGVSGNEFLGRFGRNMWKIYGSVIDGLREQGLIEVSAPQVWLTERGIDVSNQVLSRFLL
ncbi:MAG: oxygen-independent coproporphyrinogen III oxidase [Lachnospiraceae bacterium]|jgi:putative oxygen-independent coproporphyrinogen III oxidase|nr:oxygen-independent coproporphyrinogen III oxidase [Lachnospiraceae bacterium]